LAGTGRPAGGSESALRALRSAREEVEALRRGGAPPAEARGYVLRVANAVDRALRRLLRDDEAADLSIRLKALAPDELRSDAVLAELRRNERLPMRVAAAVHELLDTRVRLERGGTPDPDDAARAVHVTDALERAIRGADLHAPPPREVVDDEVHEVPAAREWRSSPIVPLAAGAGALLLTVVLLVWVLGGRGPDHMEQGIALFRTGAYSEAAHHFWRHAQDNPGDATPHLYLARIHRRMDRPELAAEAIREAQQRAPDDPAVHRELGFLLLDTGRADVAVERFRQAIDLEPDSSEGWVGLVRALRESGRGAEVDRVIEQAPAEVRALLRRTA
jgi:tetratricopeptide (TPR) repeat protein